MQCNLDKLKTQDPDRWKNVTERFTHVALKFNFADGKKDVKNWIVNH